jgi:hypothetical protein
MVINSSLHHQPELSVGADAASISDRQVLSLLQRHSHLCLAIIEIRSSAAAASLSQTVLYANGAFNRLVGVEASPENQETNLLACLSSADQVQIQQRFRRYLLEAIFHQRYGLTDLIDRRLLSEPIVVTLKHPQLPQERQVEMHLKLAIANPDAQPTMQITHLSPAVAAALDACWTDGKPTKQQVMAQLLSPDTPLSQVIETLQPGTYEAGGRFLLEGMDVTEREITQSLIHLLVSRESVLEPQRFGRANQLMQRLFRADGSLILSAENDQATLFTHLHQPEWQTHIYSVHSLQSSLFFQATERAEVINVPDLSHQCLTDCEQTILQMGVRSLLIIPLVMKATALGKQARRLLGLVGITSQMPYAFNQADSHNATALIPALTAAMRHTVQDRFTNIHPSVRWRFEQEAERRSWGLPAEAIVFESVYPLYGISDIRGSSDERNRAIQADLVLQFELALAIMKAVCDACPNAFAQQFRLDLEERLEQLYRGITVDAEVTLLRYLQDELEAHFAYFRDAGPEAAAAIATYQAALDPEQGCVYQARAEYDTTISRINRLLRNTWERWQQPMQTITQHYCDVEATDGIDHMIYAGQSIDSQFSQFHLRSLRYEQLRAVCDCARAAFQLKQQQITDLEVTHLVLVQASTVDITHDEHTERLFDVRGTRDTRYEIVKKRIDKACDAQTRDRITQPGMLTVVYSTEAEGQEYRQYLRYLQRESIVDSSIEQGLVEPLQGVNGLKFLRVMVLPDASSTTGEGAPPGQHP